MAWPRESFCPSCERFIGPAEECPYCNADAATNPMLKLLRRGSVALALGGLLALHIMAVHRQPTAIRAVEITPRMQYAHAVLAGTVVAAPRVSEDEGRSAYISFLLDDGTGRIRVFLAGAGARELLACDGVPGKGNRVQVTGQLNVAAGRLPKLRVHGPDQLTVLDVAAPPPVGDDAPSKGVDPEAPQMGAP
ncbi:MAG: hypothetical protein E4H02_03475 [Lentisphaerales bacterium]|nr:MAG: hypothetical protein E4H02_03475 [Lentisphaerales bacterium]